jgi:cyclopropane fatty-acyl-phospholipid synthase-like methyltransferase
MEIVKPHILAFAERIKQYDRAMLEALCPDDLYRLYLLLDDLAHLDAGEGLAGRILDEPEIRRELPLIRDYYKTFFSIHEVHVARLLLDSSAPWKTFKSFPLYPRYEALIRSQMKTGRLKSGGKLAFIGSGAVPSSLILLSHLAGIRSLGLDTSQSTVEISREVVRCLGLEKEIKIFQGNETLLETLDWDMILVAAMAEPKERIFRNLRHIMLEKGKTKARVVFRTYTGMRAILYEPVCPADTEGFKIVKSLFPAGRVNNTTVVARLAEQREHVGND